VVGQQAGGVGARRVGVGVGKRSGGGGSELGHSVEHPYGASRCTARFSIRCATLLPAWLTLGLLRHVAHLIWLKQNYKSVLEPQPTARLLPAARRKPSPSPWDRSPACAAATGALDPVARPLMRRIMVNTTGGGTRLGASRCASHRCGSRSARWVSAAVPPIL